MHIQSSITKTICTFLCALLIIGCIGNATLTAQASDLPFAGVAGDYLEKLIDMALSKAGVVAEEAIIDKIKDDYITFLLNTGDGYLNYLKDNGIDDVNVDTWKAYVNQSDLAQWQKDFALSCPEVAVYYYERYQDNIDGLIISEEEALNALGISDATYGKQYTIPSVAVNFMRNLFKNRETEYGGYIMIPTYSPSTLPASIFPESSYYSSVRNYATASDNLTIIYGHSVGDASIFPSQTMNCNNVTCSGLYDNRKITYLVSEDIKTKYAYFYDNTAKSVTYSRYGLSLFKDASSTTIYNYIDANSASINETGNPIANYYTGWPHNIILITKDGRNIPVFKDVASLSNYLAGQVPYYTTTTYNNWDSSTDNSITYTGDYLIDNSSERSYTTINTSEDYSQTNIDNSVTNITNNYIYTSPNAPSEDEGGGDDGGSDSGLTLGDALNTWVTAIKEFITFALNLLGEAVALISGFLNDALTLLTGLTDSFSGFTGLLASMFSFLPQEVIDALSAGIVLIIVLGVIKGLKG